MSDSVLADFVGTLTVETTDWDDPVDGRVLLNSTQLVFVTDESEEKINVGDIFDVNLGFSPRNMGPFPGTAITVAYEWAGNRNVAVVAAKEETIDRFNAMLFRAILNGRKVTVKHPARVGGRVTDESFELANLRLSRDGVTMVKSTDEVTIEHTAVTEFDETAREVHGENRTTLTIGHMNDGVGQTTYIATDTPRVSALLGRYLRQNYDELMASLEDVTLSKQAVEALNTMYTIGGEPGQLVSVLDMHPDKVKKLVNKLGSDGLIQRTEDGFDLTTKGQVVVNHYMARVNQ